MRISSQESDDNLQSNKVKRNALTAISMGGLNHFRIEGRHHLNN